MSLRIGIGLFTGQIPAGTDRTFAREYRDTVDLVRLAESAGFSSAWVSEHHGASDGYLPSLLVMLAALAEATSEMALGAGVILAPLHDPIRLAEDAAVVDNLSGGRLILGLGLGWREEEFRMLRIPIRERRARLEETIEILRRAWTGERFSFEGSVFRFDRVRVTPPPARQGGPPVLLGGYVEDAFRRAGALGDGHVTDAWDPEELLHAVSTMDEAATRAGKDPSALRLVLTRNAFVTERGDAWAEIRDGVAHQWGAYEAWDAGHDTPENDSLEPPLRDLEPARAATIAGPPEEVARELAVVVEPYRDRHVELVVRLHYPGMGYEKAARAIELFGARVLPALIGP
jgi:probable F420-dependent oxidoreductase